MQAQYCGQEHGCRRHHFVMLYPYCYIPLHTIAASLSYHHHHIIYKTFSLTVSCFS